MVFQWVNFVQETNNWWLRRVRPLMFASAFLWLGFHSYRYYFFGKWSVYKQDHYTPEQRAAQAKENQRDWGYGAYYKPTLARSRKRQLQETLGGLKLIIQKKKKKENYRYSEKWENMYTYDMRSLPEILEEENNWE